MYLIKDWAGNILNYNNCFSLPQLAVEKEFSSFEDAWDYIYENYTEEDYQEFYVERMSYER